MGMFCVFHGIYLTIRTYHFHISFLNFLYWFSTVGGTTLVKCLLQISWSCRVELHSQCDFRFPHYVPENERPEILYKLFGLSFLARLYKVQGELLQSPRLSASAFPSHGDSFIFKFSKSSYLDSHSSESIHTWTIDTLEGRLLFHISWPQGWCRGVGLEIKT